MGRKVELYIMSLKWLFVLLALQALSFQKEMSWCSVIVTNVPTIVCLILFGVAWLCEKRFLYCFDDTMSRPYTIKKIKSKDYEFLIFLVTYIVPLCAFDLHRLSDVLTLVALVIFLGYLFTKTKVYYFNPALALKLKLYVADIECNQENVSDCLLLSKEVLKIGDIVVKHSLEEDGSVVFVKRITE